MSLIAFLDGELGRSGSLRLVHDKYWAYFLSGLLALRRRCKPLLRFRRKGGFALLYVPVCILHGSSDNSIRSTESLWLQKEIPPAYLREVLTTPAFGHFDPARKMAWQDQVCICSHSAHTSCAACHSAQDALRDTGGPSHIGKKKAATKRSS
jgi:hypothetical protein